MPERWKNKPEYTKKAFLIAKPILEEFTQVAMSQGMTPAELLRNLVAKEIREAKNV